MKNIGYYNGNMGPLEEMKIPMNDRASYFGDGVYEAVIVADGVPFALEDHFDRFYDSLKILEIILEHRVLIAKKGTIVWADALSDRKLFCAIINNVLVS